MKKVIYLFVVSMMMVVTACSSKGGGSSSGGDSSEGSGSRGPEYEFVDKIVTIVNDFAIAYKAGDNAKQEELINKWNKLEEENKELIENLDENQLKNIQEYINNYVNNQPQEFKYFNALIVAKADAAQNNTELIDFSYEYGEDEITYSYEFSNHSLHTGRITYK